MTNIFVETQRREQATYFSKVFPDSIGEYPQAYRLNWDKRYLNLLAPIREDARDYFEDVPKIQWHRHANHALSSQVCCVNFLFPFADKPELLSQWVAHVLGIEPPHMLAIERDRANRDWFVAFEWIGEKDYLNESDASGERARGEKATAPDAAVTFRTVDGQIHLLLIEWKYTESYDREKTAEEKAREGAKAPERKQRYRDIMFSPKGPLCKDDLLDMEDIFKETLLYQLVRQQMLAWHIEKDSNSGIDRAQVLHISPSGNSALHRVTIPRFKHYGDDVFDVFRSLLVDQTNFLQTTIEQAFAPLGAWPQADWYRELRERYPTLCRSPEDKQ